MGPQLPSPFDSLQFDLRVLADSKPSTRALAREAWGAELGVTPADPREDPHWSSSDTGLWLLSARWGGNSSVFFGADLESASRLMTDGAWLKTCPDQNERALWEQEGVPRIGVWSVKEAAFKSARGAASSVVSGYRGTQIQPISEGVPGWIGEVVASGWRADFILFSVTQASEAFWVSFVLATR